MARKMGGNPNANLVSLKFGGHWRGPVKTSIAPASKTETFSDLGKLLDTLKPDKEMRAKYKLRARTVAEKQKQQKGVTGPSPRSRFAEENRNVRVSCWISAVKFESGKTGDNDCHVILSSSAGAGANARFMTAEISGLPAGGKDKAKLTTARQQFVALFPNVKLEPKYYQPSQGIKVKVTGSLFFDADHLPGRIGPHGKNPGTVWEIHPVTAITKA